MSASLRKRTCVHSPRYVCFVQKQTHTPQQTTPSLDYRIRDSEQPVRQGEAEHAGGLCVDDQLEFVRLYDRQIRGLCTLEDAAGVKADLAPRIPQVGSVA